MNLTVEAVADLPLKGPQIQAMDFVLLSMNQGASGQLLLHHYFPSEMHEIHSWLWHGHRGSQTCQDVLASLPRRISCANGWNRQMLAEGSSCFKLSRVWTTW